MKKAKTILWRANVVLLAIHLVGVALLGLWVRSYFVGDSITWSSDWGMRRVWTNPGKVCVQITRDPGRTITNTLRYDSHEPSANKHLPWWRNWWINWRKGPMDDPGRQVTDRVGTAPYWLLVFTLYLLPVLAATWGRRRFLRSWREKRGLCIVCGYDLHGTAGDCPECGHGVKPGS